MCSLRRSFRVSMTNATGVYGTRNSRMGRTGANSRQLVIIAHHHWWLIHATAVTTVLWIVHSSRWSFVNRIRNLIHLGRCHHALVSHIASNHSRSGSSSRSSGIVSASYRMRGVGHRHRTTAGCIHFLYFARLMPIIFKRRR